MTSANMEGAGGTGAAGVGGTEDYVVPGGENTVAYPPTNKEPRDRTTVDNNEDEMETTESTDADQPKNEDQDDQDAADKLKNGTRLVEAG